MAKTINGIFEPFHKYVSKQLDIRKTILTPKGAILSNVVNNNTIETANLSEEEQIEKLKEEIEKDNLSIQDHTNNNLLHTYTTQKQCTLRMTSGVDLREKNDILTEYEKLRLGITKGDKKYFTDEYEDEGDFYDGSNFAKFWRLQGGIEMDWSDQLHFPESRYNNNPESLKLRGGIHGDPILSKYVHADDRAYGSPLLRGDAIEGYGIVPMPGIINAEISTKSEDGSLREAKVNFVAHNKRQLEVLEMLYMRPGYPIMLEWGWLPFINNNTEVIHELENYDGAVDYFLDGDSDLSEINLKIREQKAETGGNYDGFVGFCKNFLFKAREDGGYDCTTEIIAHGEILESLKSPIRTTPELVNYSNFDYQIATDENNKVDFNSQGTKFLSAESYESIDSFLFYLKSIKANLDQAGIKAALTFDGTDYAHYGRAITTRDENLNRIKKDFIKYDYEHTDMLDQAPYEAFFTPTIGTIKYHKNDYGVYKINEEDSSKITNQAGLYEKQAIEAETGGTLYNNVLEADYILRNVYKHGMYQSGQTSDGRVQSEENNLPVFVYYKVPGANGEERIIPTNYLNVVHNQYIEGFSEIEQLVMDVTKVSAIDLLKEKENWQVIPSFLYNQITAYGSKYMGGIVVDADGRNLKSNYEPFRWTDTYPLRVEKDDLNFKKGASSNDVVSAVNRAIINRENEYSPSPVFGMEMDTQYTFEKEGWRVVSEREESGTKRKRKGAMSSLGLQSMLQGTILKEFSLVDETATDSGIRKKIFVRWDLICQIINRLTTPNYKTDHAIVELTYLTKDTPTFRSGGKTRYDQDENGNVIEGQYLPYSRDTTSHILPLWGPEQFGFKKEDFPTTPEDLLEPETLQKLKKEEKFAKEHGGTIQNNTVHSVTYPPLLGRSFDSDICLMPHQIEGMHSSDTVLSAAEKPPSEGNWGYNPDVYSKSGQRRIYTGASIINDKNFTSFNNIKSDEANSIGHVYFNLDYLISTYESLATEEYKTTNSLGEERSKKRLKKKFSMHDFITDIWNGVNDACGGFYDFGLHTEHERPHVARVVDFTMNGGTKDLDSTQKIFEFDPQSIRTITRDTHYQSKLDNDFAATISIAAQVPNDIQSLESVSFKAFHKGITNRFTDNSADKDYRDQEIEEARTRYIEDYKEYIRTIKSLLVYIKRQNESNFETDFIDKNETTGEEAYILRPISPSTAKSMAQQLHDQRIALLSRYPTHDTNLVPYDADHPTGNHTGEYRDDLTIAGSPTFERNAIIPLTVSIELDGISGISPLNIFKINSDKLPKGYNDPNIVFVVKKLSEKITKNQDWSTSLTGYLSFLNDNPTTGLNLDLITNDDEQINEMKIKIDKILDATERIEEAGTDETPFSATTWINPFHIPLDFTDGNLWPKRKKGSWHAGVDIKMVVGTELIAPRTGHVIQCGEVGGYGYYTVIEFEEEDPTIRHNMWDIGAPEVGNYQVSEDGLELVGDSKEETYPYPKNALPWTTGERGKLTGYRSSGKPVKRALFAHMSKIDFEWVGTKNKEFNSGGYPWKNEEEKKKYRVVQGEVIGESGGKKGAVGSGNSLGPHLHYEIGTEDAFTKKWWKTAWAGGRGSKRNPFSNSSDKDKRGTQNSNDGKRYRIFYANIDPRYVLTEEGLQNGFGSQKNPPTFPPFDTQGGWNSNPNSEGYKTREAYTTPKLIQVVDILGRQVYFKGSGDYPTDYTGDKNDMGIYYSSPAGTKGEILKNGTVIIELYDNGSTKAYQLMQVTMSDEMGSPRVIAHLKTKYNLPKGHKFLIPPSNNPSYGGVPGQ